jgi:hypothetical protein
VVVNAVPVLVVLVNDPVLTVVTLVCEGVASTEVVVRLLVVLVERMDV